MYQRMLVEVISSNRETNTILNLRRRSKPSIGERVWVTQVVAVITILGTDIILGRVLLVWISLVPVYLMSQVPRIVSVSMTATTWVTHTDALRYESLEITHDVEMSTVTRHFIRLGITGQQLPRCDRTQHNEFIKWKGCHVHSNIFIRLVSGYSCVSYLIASVLIINLLCYSDLNLDININQELGFISSLLFGRLFSSCVLDCNRDSIREYTSCYEILCYHMLSLLVVFVISEIMFVWVYFWSSSNITYSSSSLQLFQTIQDIRTSQTQDPNALTSTNTILLSFSGISLGCTYHIRVTHTLYHSPYLICFLLSHLFGSWQIKEFQDVNFYLNECSTSSVFFYLIGLHFFHVAVGIILLLLFLVVLILQQ